jgi:hypothetical protein
MIKTQQIRNGIFKRGVWSFRIYAHYASIFFTAETYRIPHQGVGHSVDELGAIEMRQGCLKSLTNLGVHIVRV